jgi:hypothetical protein
MWKREPQISIVKYHQISMNIPWTDGLKSANRPASPAMLTLLTVRTSSTPALAPRAQIQVPQLSAIWAISWVHWVNWVHELPQNDEAVDATRHVVNQQPAAFPSAKQRERSRRGATSPRHETPPQPGVVNRCNSEAGSTENGVPPCYGTPGLHFMAI